MLSSSIRRLLLGVLFVPAQGLSQTVETPVLPSAPLPYDSIRDTPAAPIPYSRLTTPTAPIIAPNVYDLPQAPPKAVPIQAQTRITPQPVPQSAPSDFNERVSLARRLLEIDGTEVIVRHHVNQVHMRLILTEAGKYIDLNALSENDRYRLATIAALAATELGDSILRLSAHVHAENLTREELRHLIDAYDIEPQRKLTQMRIDDTGELDKNAELQMQIAALRIIQAFESP